MAQSPFEIPQQLRELTEKNVEQARASYGQFMDAVAQAMGMWSKALPSNELTTGFEAVQKKAVKFAKQNAEAGFQLANDLANAKEVQNVISLQSRYVQSQMQNYALQAQELGSLMAGAVQNKAP
jgi:phasin